MIATDALDRARIKSCGCTYLGPDYDSRTWPYNRGVPTPYCGAPNVEGKSYCVEHYGVVYGAGTALRKRLKDQRRVNAIRALESLFNECVAELEAEGFDMDARPLDADMV